MLGELGASGAGSGLLEESVVSQEQWEESEYVFKLLRNRIRFSVVKRSFWPQVLGSRTEGRKQSKERRS